MTTFEGGGGRTVKEARFTFEMRWKELLYVFGPGGSFVLDLWMGTGLAAQLPTKEAWERRAPEWARGLWDDLAEDLAEWCRLKGAALEIEENASIWPPADPVSPLGETRN
jgi:hypothetical protein